MFESLFKSFRYAFLWKETPTQMFSFEYRKDFKNTYFEKHIPTAASVDCRNFYRATESQIEIKFE